ncbi:MAG: MFS transporter [Thermodesulfobacteriota bacterium]
MLSQPLPQDQRPYLAQLFSLFLGSMIAPMGGIGVVPLIPVLTQQWSLPFSQATLIIPFYMIPFIVIQLMAGSLAQLFDERKAMLAGLLVYSLGASICGLAPDRWVLFAGRLVQGSGAGLVIPVAMAQMGELVPPRHLGKTMGMLGLFNTAGVTLGPLISGLLETHYGWPAFFYFLTGLALFAGLLYLPASRSAARPAGGPMLLGAVLADFRRSLALPGSLAVGFAAFFLFVCYIGIMTFTAQYLKTVHGLASDKVGALLSMAGIAGVVISPFAGYLGDRFGRQRVILAGSGLALVGILLMVLLPYTYNRYLIWFLMYGTGVATAWTVLNTMAVDLSLELRRPVSSLYNAIKFTGYAIAPQLLALLWDLSQLSAVQWGCLAAVIIATLLALRGQARTLQAARR